MVNSLYLASAIIFGVAGVVVFLLAVIPSSMLRRASGGHRRLAGLVTLLVFVAQAEHAVGGWPMAVAVFETAGIVLACIGALILFLAKSPAPSA